MIKPADLSDKQFRYFNEVVYRETGIKLTELKKALMQARLMKRTRELSMDGFDRYREYLAENYADEIVHFINCITTNKTDFFREPVHFDFMRKVALPAIEERGQKSIRIWSAGCSTGEEPYTVAITICEHFAGARMPEVKILATDIDTQVLRKGHEGVYRADSLEGLDVVMLRRYFQRGGGSNAGLFRVKESLRRMVYFRRLNLIRETYPLRRSFDLIFCRNVIIYFDRETQGRLFARLHRHLDDDGYLFLGHSETFTAATGLFTLLRNTVYRKNVQGAS